MCDLKMFMKFFNNRTANVIASKNNILSKSKVLERTIVPLSNNLSKRASSTCLTLHLYRNSLQYKTAEHTYLKPKYLQTKHKNSNHFIQMSRNEHSGVEKFTDLSNNANHEFNTSYIDASDNDTRFLLEKDMIVYEDFITKEEEQSLLNEIEPYMKRLKYEYDHWDNVSKLSKNNAGISCHAFFVFRFCYHVFNSRNGIDICP